ncbi:MAG: signal peptidase II [Dehalococcoidales bacterium]|jgi:signal peptidase II
MERLHRLNRGNRRDLVFGAVAVLVIVADQLTKFWIRTHLAYGEVLFDIGVFRVVHVQNTGASFGILTGHTLVIIIAVFLEMLLILAVVYLFRNRLSSLDSMLMRVGAGLIFGGAIGNQVDRLARGYVTDFIDFKWWPAWNVADASAVVGTIIVAYCILFHSNLGKRKA